MQKVLVFQQNKSGEKKIAALGQYGKSLVVETVSIDEGFPALIEDTSPYLPEDICADLVLNYLTHPDLSHDLGKMCADSGIPVVAPGRKMVKKGVFTPPTCCGLGRNPVLGPYGEQFGSPEFAVETDGRVITRIRVLRGAPCGATWEAARSVEGLPIEEAGAKIGLLVQFSCIADPAGWDPIWGKSPVHFAGHVHNNALKKALKGAK